MTEQDAGVMPPLPTMPSGLKWGVKASFLRYVTGLPDGTYSGSGGVVVEDDNQFIFPASGDTDYDPASQKGILKFGGTISLSGHGGMMHVTISNPWIELLENESLLTIALVDEQTSAVGRRIPLALLTPAENPVHEGSPNWSDIRAVLAPEGMFVFNDQYLAGEQLDPLTVICQPAGT